MSPPVDSSVSSVREVFTRGAFLPASVQRDYQWRTGHCLTLLNDIDRVFLSSSFAPAGSSLGDVAPEADADRIDIEPVATPGESTPPALDVYMLGTIVLTRDRERQFAIYDGLQRLTTLTILFAVLRDLTIDPALSASLDDLVSEHTAGGIARLSLAGRDTTLVTQVQPRGEAGKLRRGAPKTDMGRRIRFAAQAFREKLKPWPSARRDGFSRFLMERVFIDVQVAADARLARQIFVTTNTRGRSLDAIDLFKGQLTDITDNEASAAQVVGHWNGLRATMGDRLSEFLHAVDFIERAEPQGSDCLNALAEHVAATRGPGKVETFVQGLSTLGADYNALMDVCSAPPTDALSADIWRLQLFRWSQWRPLALLWYGDYRRARQSSGAGAARRIEAARRRFDALHRRCMGIVLAGFSGGDRETIFARAVSQAKSGANPLSASGALAFKDVHMARISDALRLPITDQDIRSTVVRWLESLAHGDVPPPHVKTATVEHILPRRPAAGSDWIEAFPDIEQRYFACHALGNLAAMDRERNETIRNATFAAKRAALAAAATGYRTLDGIADEDTWSAETIERRTERLAKQIETLLALPISIVA